jgi:hypothetical protein
VTETESKIERVLLALGRERQPNKTFCPSEAARRLEPDDWRELMPAVCAAAILLFEAGKLRCTQRGEDVNPAHARGPVRFSLPPLKR